MSIEYIKPLNSGYWKSAVERVKFARWVATHLNRERLFVAFSGGKDSVVLYDIVKKAAEEEGIPMNEYAYVFYNLTTVDPPELVHFIKSEYPDVEILKPRFSMWQLIERAAVPPLPLWRYCCRELKECTVKGEVLLTGVRWAESSRRRAKRGVYEVGRNASSKAERIKVNDNDEMREVAETCTLYKQHFFNPIVDWEDNEIWDYIKTQKLKYCKLYDEGAVRLGCIGCPMASIKQREAQFKKYPKYKDAYIRAFDKMLKAHPDKKYNWANGQEVFDWWLYGGKKE